VTITTGALLLAAVDTLIGAALLWLVIRLQGRLREELDMHRRQRRGRERELEDFRQRRGRFAGLDPDTEDRPQVMPVPEPPAERQTHAPGFAHLGEEDERRGDDEQRGQ
jgi:hypothetical protein